MALTDGEKVARALTQALISTTAGDIRGEAVNLVEGLALVASEIHRATDLLGTNQAMTRMGALELISLALKEAGEQVGGGLSEVASAINLLASAIEGGR